MKLKSPSISLFLERQNFQQGHLRFQGSYLPPDKLKLPEEPNRLNAGIQWVKDLLVKPKTLEEVAELLRPNTVILNSNNYSRNGSGVWIRDENTGKYYILTCQHIFKLNDVELGTLPEFFFASRNPETKGIVTGSAKIIQRYDVDGLLDYNDLMLLEPTDGQGALVAHPPKLASTGLLYTGPDISKGDPAIVCSSGHQGLMDKVEMTILLDSAFIGHTFEFQYADGRVEDGDSGSAVYNRKGDLMGILTKGYTNDGGKRAVALSLDSLRDFLERQCGLDIG